MSDAIIGMRDKLDIHNPIFKLVLVNAFCLNFPIPGKEKDPKSTLEVSECDGRLPANLADS